MYKYIRVKLSNEVYGRLKILAAAANITMGQYAGVVISDKINKEYAYYSAVSYECG